MRKLAVPKSSVENVPFAALALGVICHEVSCPSRFFLAIEFFMATILKLKVVAKRQLFEKVSLEC